MSDSDSASGVEGVIEGKRFRVPTTISVMRSLFTPRCYKSPSMWIWIATCLFTNGTFLLHHAGLGEEWRPYITTFFTLQFVFWRLAYNVGIGAMLHFQSNGKAFERAIAPLLKNPAFRSLLERHVTFRDPKEKPFKVDDYPAAFSAWMVFRFIVNIILANDLLAYFVLVWVHWVPADFNFAPTFENGLLDVGRIGLGIGLVVFALWSKSDAHRVIGDYAWYWGDFFFLLDQELTFDGIFEMFPHPMYTVGYAFMYGFSLLSQSHTVFYWSVFGHLCQIVFLTVVENPHIERTYKETYTPEQEREAREQEELLYDDERGYFEKKELVLLHNFKIHRGPDLLLAVCLGYTGVVGYLTGLDATALAVQYFFWRVLLNVGLGWALREQSANQRLTHAFGSSRRAFDSWKVLYNTVVTVTNFAYLMCAFAAATQSLPALLRLDDEWRVTSAVVGALLVAINAWCVMSIYDAVGDYGFFYGDFFIEACPKRLAYSGVYRFLNNPDTVLGCAWYYGVAFITYSPQMGVLALVTHAFVKGFEVLVERPHMRRRYGSKLRKEAGVNTAIKTRAKSVRSELKDKQRRLRAEYNRAMENLRAEASRRTREFEADNKRLSGRSE